MKALKVVGVVVGVVAIVASGGALLAGAGTFLGMSAATLGTIATAASLAAAAIGAGMALFAPKPGFSTQGNPLAFQTNPQSGLPYPIGRTRMSGLRIHAETYDAPAFKSESKDDVLAFAVMLGAGGPMDAIETFRADKVATTFDGSTGAATSGFSGDYMAQKVSLGLAGASALALTFGSVAFPGWTTDHKLSGISHALWTLRYDEKGNTYGAGVPEPEWIGRWVKVYDPRLDSTYPGGSGAHRALDEATYAWSANPALHALTWCLGRWQNSKRTLGIGAPVANIRVSDFVEAANIADANDWTCGGVEWSTDSKWSILKRMLQAAGAEPTMSGAMIGCRVNAPRVSAATVTPDDLLDELSFATTRSRRDRFNTVIPRYRSEEHDWQVISGEPISVPEYVTEDGGVRTKEIDFPLVQAEVGNLGNDQAGHLAAYEIVNSREAGPIRFATGPKFIGVKTGDVVTLDVPDEGLDAQPVLIRSRSIDPATLKITFEAETETDAKHAFALGKTSVPPPTWSPVAPDLTPPTPDAALWALTASYSADFIPAIMVTGASEFPGADAVLIEYKRVADSAWSTLGRFAASEPVKATSPGLDASTSYHARLAYQSGSRTGPWRTLTAVTTLANGASEVLANFNARNDRNSAAISAPTIATDGGAVDHVINDDGSAATSLEWTFSTGSEPDIDGFEVAVIELSSATPQTVGAVPGIEKRIPVTPRHRAAFHNTAANKYLTWGVRAQRVVDPDVWDVWAAANPSLAGNTSKPIIVSAWAQPSIAGENPYRPASNTAFLGDISGTAGYAPSLFEPGMTVNVYRTHTGAIIAGQLFKYQLTRKKGDTDVSASASWSVITGSATVSNGLVTVTGFGSFEDYILIRSAYEGIDQDHLMPIKNFVDMPPQAVDENMARGSPFGFAAFSSASYSTISGVMAAKAGATGAVQVINFGPVYAEAAGNFDCTFKLQRRPIGGSWVDVTTTATTAISFDALFPVGIVGGVGTATDTGLTANTWYEYQVLALRRGTSTTTGRFHTYIFAARGY